MATLLLLASCKKDRDLIYDKSFAGIYFEQDSIYYSFGVTPLETDRYELHVPVEIMGTPSNTDRAFSVVIDNDKTTAEAGKHYTVPTTFTIPADSINGFVPVTILRKDLGDSDFKLAFKLVKNDNFTPVNEDLKEVLIHFNNRVEPPTWKDWQGNPTWPDFYLGKWNPLTYIKFIEYFRAIEQEAPATYESMVKQYGPDLQNVTYGWPYDYQYTMKKYVLIPLYNYFMIEHPDLGVTIPKPI